MGHIKEPEGIDFIIKSKPLTNTEREEISELIKMLKKKKITRKSNLTSKNKITETF